MNYTTTISLTPQDNKRFQAVYASQRYGTFFGIFAKFNIQKKNEIILLKHLDLELINYKGLLNLSIVDAKIDGEAREKKRDVPVILLKVTVMAKTGDIINEKRLIPNVPIQVKKDQFFSVFSEVLPLSGVNKKSEPFVDGLFDNEFYYRDGLVTKPRVVTEIDLKTDVNQKNELGFDFESPLIDKDRFSSIRCRVGNSVIVTSN